MRKRVAILGATGSIGSQALDVIAAHPDRFVITALAAGRNIERVVEAVRTFAVPLVSIAAESDAATVQVAVGPEVRVVSGAAGLLAVACENSPDIVLAATDGAVAFDAVFEAVRMGTDIAVANKELIVAAGDLLIAAAATSGARLVPVDSEHSAIFQCLVGEDPASIERIVLTASGGPFRSTPLASMERITVAEALAHPTWSMGVKNSIDSATMMNKALEVIEAARLFSVPGDRVSVVIHPTSVVHGFVVFRDGNVKAQLAAPDMRLAIGYALAFPDRLSQATSRRDSAQTEIDRDGLLENATADVGLAALGGRAVADQVDFRFERVDSRRFPALDLAFRALREAETASTVLSAANEIAVQAFVEGKIRFTEIVRVVESTMDLVPRRPLTLSNVRAADVEARHLATRLISTGLPNQMSR